MNGFPPARHLLASLLTAALLLPAGADAEEISYEFSGEGQSLLQLMQNPPHGTDYCSLRFYMNGQSVVYAFSKQPGSAGLELGDRIVSINEVPMEGPPSIPDAVVSLKSTDTLRIIADRGGKAIQVERKCVDDTEIDKTIVKLAEAIIAEDWSECRTLVEKVERHEKRSEWINLRMRCNYMYAQSREDLPLYWNRDWPLDLYQYQRLALQEASYGSMEEFEELRPSVIRAISDLRRNSQSMYSGDLNNDFERAARKVQIRNGLPDPDEDSSG